MAKIEISKKIALRLSEIKLLEDVFLNLICVFYEENISGGRIEHGDLFTDLWGTEVNSSKIEARFHTVANARDLIEILKVNFNAGGFSGGGY